MTSVPCLGLILWCVRKNFVLLMFTDNTRSSFGLYHFNFPTQVSTYIHFTSISSTSRLNEPLKTKSNKMILDSSPVNMVIHQWRIMHYANSLLTESSLYQKSFRYVLRNPFQPTGSASSSSFCQRVFLPEGLQSRNVRMTKEHFAIKPVLSPRVIRSGSLALLETLPGVSHYWTLLGPLVRQGCLRHPHNNL